MKTSNFSRYLTQYLTHYLPVQRNLSSNTIRSYRDTFKLLLIFCRDEKGLNIAKLTLSKLDKKCIEDYLLWIVTVYIQPTTLRDPRFFRLCYDGRTQLYGTLPPDPQNSEYGSSNAAS